MAQDALLAARLDARDIDHRRRRAGQLTTVDREVGGGYELWGNRGEIEGRRFAGPVGRGLKQRARCPVSGPSISLMPSRSAILAAGKWVAVLWVGDHERHRPRQQRREGVACARAKARTSSRIASGEK